MKLYENNETPELTSDINNLMRTAKNIDDLSSWFKKNLQSLGMIPPENMGLAEVQIGLSNVESLFAHEIENPILKAYVSVTLENNAERSPTIKQLFKMDNFGKSEATSSFRVFLSFNDWPFLTCNLAVTSLQKLQQGHSDEGSFKTKVEPILQKYVPMHFPGLTWETLVGLQSSGLLPLKEENSLDEDALTEMLFTRRESLPEMKLSDLTVMDHI